MIEHTDTSRLHYIGKRVVFALIMILVCTIGLQWSWNAVASELFTMPSMQFKHALGLEILTGVVFFIFCATVRLFLYWPQRRMRGGWS